MSGFFDNFALEGLTTIANKVLESSNNLKNVENNHTHHITGNLQKVICFSSLLYGSIYLYSVSLRGMNDMMIHHKKENGLMFPFLLLNGSVLIGSTFTFMVCVGHLLKK